MHAPRLLGLFLATLVTALAMAPAATANPATALDTAAFPVEIRPCHSQYESFQLWINGQPASKCFVILPEAADQPVEVRQCAGPNSAQLYVQGKPRTVCFVWN